jgi:hypothetical protein
MGFSPKVRTAILEREGRCGNVYGGKVRRIKYTAKVGRYRESWRKKMDLRCGAAGCRERLALGAGSGGTDFADSRNAGADSAP